MHVYFMHVPGVGWGKCVRRIICTLRARVIGRVQETPQIASTVANNLEWLRTYGVYCTFLHTRVLAVRYMKIAIGALLI